MLRAGIFPDQGVGTCIPTTHKTKQDSIRWTTKYNIRVVLLVICLGLELLGHASNCIQAIQKNPTYFLVRVEEAAGDPQMSGRECW